MTITQTNASRVLVDIAESAIRGWAGNLYRHEAERQLDLWQHSEALTEDERSAVLDRFEADHDPVPGSDFLLPPDAPSVPPLTAEELADVYEHEDPVTDEPMPEGVDGVQLGRAAEAVAS